MIKFMILYKELKMHIFMWIKAEIKAHILNFSSCKQLTTTFSLPQRGQGPNNKKKLYIIRL